MSSFNDTLVIPFDPDETRFETLGEFKRYIDEGWELSFEYNGVEYGVDKNEDGTFCVWNCDKRQLLDDLLTLDQILDYRIDGVKIRDFIITDNVLNSDRPGPRF